MADATGEQHARPLRRLGEALAGGALALGLITVANAALPRTDVPTLARPDTRTLHAASRAPAPPPALIAFQPPAPGYAVISPFGLRQLPWEESGRLHAGVDIAGPTGQPVLAAADGVVTRLAVDAGYGRFVEVRHTAGLSSRYGHLARYAPQIVPGAAVQTGQPLGVMGSTGTSTGSHLHFELRDARDRPLNPEMFLGRRFATQADLPLRAAARIPRGVRVAYVSRIPKTKREEMQARIELAAVEQAARASADEAPLHAGDAAADAAAGPVALSPDERPRGRFAAPSGG
jgi:murein DD-endopeptidase MepM/ murein hydrolase activator NlpD